MINTLNGIIPIDMLLNNSEKEIKYIDISILTRHGRTTKWTLSNNQPRKIHKRRKIKIKIPPIGANLKLGIGLGLVGGCISDKICYLSDERGIERNNFSVYIPKNKGIEVEYYLDTKVLLDKVPANVTYSVIIVLNISGIFYTLHKWLVSPERSHKWESTKRKLEEIEYYNSPIKIPVDFVEKL